MSNDAIKAAFAAELDAMPGKLTATPQRDENLIFEPPGRAVPYQSEYLMPAKPFNPCAGSNGPTRYTGYYQVSLRYPVNTGEAAAVTQAKLIKAHFRQGLPITANGVTTVIAETPEIKSGRVEVDRYVLPVRIPYFANV